MNLEILNNDQVTRISPELGPPSSSFHNTLMGGRLSHDRFNVHRPSPHGSHRQSSGAFLWEGNWASKLLGGNWYRLYGAALKSDTSPWGMYYVCKG
ncbi:hypothetical protein TNCV_2829421 [Trichonephila clavipes]|nr:hypothetical protein TNCV_2829421 [Trichonephila clavipes]